MFINTLLVSILLFAIIGLPILLKAWLDPDKDTSEKSHDIEADQKSNFGCGACQIKNIGNCATTKAQ